MNLNTDTIFELINPDNNYKDFPEFFDNSQEVNKSIIKLAEFIEFAKKINPKLNMEQKVLISTENYIKNIKYSIVNHLLDSSNYDSWKQQAGLSGSFLAKYFIKNIFKHELEGTDLKNKVLMDFGDIYKSNPLNYLTNEEKKTLKYYEDNNIPEINRTFNVKNEPIISELYNKQWIFERNYNNLISNASTKNKDIVDAINVIKENPLLLKDNPNHQLSLLDNKKTISSNDFGSLCLEVEMGNLDSLSKLKNITNYLKSDLVLKDAKKNISKSVRDTFFDNSNKNNNQLKN